MSFSILENAVACNHRKLAFECTRHNVFCHRKNSDKSSGLPVAVETLFRQPLSCRCPLQIFVVDPHHVLPTFVKDGGLNFSHSCDVRVALGAYINSTALRFANHLNQLRCGLQARAWKVDHMK